MRSRRLKLGSTLTELLVLVAVCAVLFTLLVPTVIETRSKLLQQACAANLKQWGTAFYMYSQDYRGSVYFGTANPLWVTVSSNPSSASPYIGYLGGTRNAGGTWQTFGGIQEMRQCPVVRLASGLQGATYAMIRPSPVMANIFWYQLNGVKHPGSMIMMLDADGTKFVIAGSSFLDPSVTGATNRHSGGVNALFADFRVDWIPYNVLATNWGTFTSSQ